MLIGQALVAGTSLSGVKLPANICHCLPPPVPCAAKWALPAGLQELELSANNLMGSIPGDWKLPESLHLLYMWNNTLEGPIPAGELESRPLGATA